MSNANPYTSDGKPGCFWRSCSGAANGRVKKLRSVIPDGSRAVRVSTAAIPKSASFSVAVDAGGGARSAVLGAHATALGVEVEARLVQTARDRGDVVVGVPAEVAGATAAGDAA